MARTCRAAVHRPGPSQVDAVRPRVWLSSGVDVDTAPIDRPVVRDVWLRTWVPGPDGMWHTADGYHHATWIELHTWFDLVEVA